MSRRVPRAPLRRARTLGAWGMLCALSSSGCEQHRNEPPGITSASEPSPNASVLPAPLAAGPPKPGGHDAGHPLAELPSDAGAPEPPRPIREDDALTAETELHVAPGLSLEARFRWLDPPPPRSPEGNVDSLNKARDKTAFDVTLELSSL